MDTTSKIHVKRPPLKLCRAMLRVCWSLSGEELAMVPLEEVPDVKALKQILHKRYGAPPRFQQSILHNGCRMADGIKLEVTQVELLLADFMPPRAGICLAVYQGDLDALEHVLQRPQDPNAEDPDYEVLPLVEAAAWGRLSCLEMLLEARADPNVKASDGATPLICAACNNHSHIMQRLLEHGADMHVVYGGPDDDDDGPDAYGTALSHACYYGHEEAACLLMQKGCGNQLVETCRALSFTASAGLPATSKIVRLLKSKKRKRLGRFACKQFKLCRGRILYPCHVVKGRDI